MMKKILFLLAVVGMICDLSAAPVTDNGSNVVVVYNTRVPESKGVAEHYALMRHVPAAQVVALDLPDAEAISRTDFRERLQKPLLKTFEQHGWFHFEPAHGKDRRVTQSIIRYVALCYGVPLLIVNDSSVREEGQERLPQLIRGNQAAVDNELACLPVLEHMMIAGPQTNPVYGATNEMLFSPTNGVLLVTRLDGPTAEIARKLVDKAMEAEQNGLWGRAYFDARGLTNGDPAKLGDDWILAAADMCTRLGFDTVIDSNYSTFPANFPLSQVAFYAGWYDEHASGPFARPTVEFMPGAFAYHLQSFSAASLRTTKRQWVGPLLDRGVTATMGCVDEPFLTGTPNIAMFFARFIYSGFSFGEAAYSSQAYLSWQTTVVGDPLYRPFARSPQAIQEDLAARHNKMLEWADLRLVNYDRSLGIPLDQVVAYLEQVDILKQSAVLQEKLSQLFVAQGKPSSSVIALENALKLDPTPQQRVRLMLNLASQLPPLNRDAEAYAVYQELLTRYPDYPNPLDIYKQLRELADKLGKKEDADKYQQMISQLTAPHHPAPATKPPVRHGV